MLEGKNYRITKENITAHELIGLKAKVVGGTEKSRIGLKGLIVDETKNLICLEAGKELRRVPKVESVFEIVIGNEKVEVDGKKILARPEDRTKFAWRKRA
ncbi:MAG: ribonuclease P protein component 1 [Candidatus Diapherotrites archaeon]|uniref:Ribonuclease P protein component 1 n=1 Tax=Candidatus Iainarchaeum sp. TaxID=3101447 RepID=A0A2D6M0P4_9ARCH|nr:ribonuclease P protein component 1 [Candidatus Diapherotrites archaeon]|tara:strand:+ start:1020 stop:1319 length:300 start_codon:yes stop_codon:yes gene_type:complete